MRSASIAFVILLCCTAEVSAKEQPDETTDAISEEVELIIVTGSRIPRDGFESLQPTFVVDQEKLKLRNDISIGDALIDQPGFSAFSSPVAEGGGLFGGVGQSFPDFLALGPQRTLTLVNGQRFPTAASPAQGSGGLQVDLNAIPAAIVDRIETISIGGAPIYGADAIAGTVNVILRDDYEGMEFFSTYGQSTEYDDAEEYRFGGTWGTNFADGRGNLVLVAEHSSQNGLIGTDRPSTSTLIGFLPPLNPDSPYDLEYFENGIFAAQSHNPYALFFGNFFFLNVFGNGIPYDINDSDSPLTHFDADGNVIPFVLGQPTASPVLRIGGDGMDHTARSSMFPDMDRYHANLFLNYDLSQSLTLHSELWFARNDAVQTANQAGYASPLFGGLPENGYGHVDDGPVPILLTNPFLTDQARGIIEPALNVVHDFDGDGIADPTIDTDGDGEPDAVGFWMAGPLTRINGKNRNTARQDTYRFLTGLDGAVELGGRAFSWDAVFTYGQTRTKQGSLAIVQPNFEQAVQVDSDASGNPVCVDPSGGCVPLDMLGMPSPEAVDYVSEWVSERVKIEQHVFAANISGDIFDLPAGPFAMAGGISYRKESADYRPSQLAEEGVLRLGLRIDDPVSGEFDTREVYSEVLVPILGGQLDTPGVETLEFEAAVRLVDNSAAGSDTTWTAGLRYAPIPDLEFRGNFTHAIRAPSITELFTPEVGVLSAAGDPCDFRLIEDSENPERRQANCAADGITQPFQSVIMNATQAGVLSGNQDLRNEFADSYTFGFVVRPRFLEQFTASVDWLDVEIGDAISNLTLTNILFACYDSAAFPDEPLCDRFQRDADGQIIDYQIGYVNIDRLHVSGLQLVANYSLEFERMGTLDLTLNHLYTDRAEITNGTDAPVEFAGVIGLNDHKVTATASWKKDRWTWFTQLRYLSDAVFSNYDDEFTRDIPEVSDWYVFNTSFAYDFNDSLSMQLNIDNVFDTDEPHGSMAGGGGVVYFPGILGRMARITVRARF